MKRFLKKVILFLSVPVVLIGITELVFYRDMQKRVEARFNQLAKSKVLLMGDSQIQRLDSSLFADSTSMLASSGEPYYATYFKLKRILDQDDVKVENVILGASPHNFAPIYNKILDREWPEGKKSMKRYFFFLDIHNSIYFNYKDVFSPKFIELIWSEPEWGGYVVSENSNPDSVTINKIFKMHYGDDSLKYRSEGMQLEYLELLSELCEKGGIKLHLISTPYHKDYVKRISPKYIGRMSVALEVMKYTKYIDFMTDDVDPNFMSDANHLNSLGSRYYTNKLLEEISVK
tara:strand:- start:37 stop:903 length:867 start_codon:yes stop_codon:yes gene_type:complete